MTRYNQGFSRTISTARAKGSGPSAVDVPTALGFDRGVTDEVVQMVEEGRHDDALRSSRKARAYVEALERAAVVGGRRSGMTWGEVGELLGMSKQAARKRHPDID